MVATGDPTLPAWKGLFEWSLQHSDGTTPAHEPSPDEVAWLQEAMSANMVDVAQRMRGIKLQLDQPPDVTGAPTLEQRQQLLDELLEIVEDVDFARDLRGVGGLPTLLSLLSDPAPGLRSRAAAVLGACAQNNAPTQQWLLAGGALPPLQAQLHDADAQARATAHTAVSCLVRRHPPALDALLQADGLGAVAVGLRDTSPRVSRKAAQLLAAVLTERPALGPPVAAAAVSLLPPLLGSGDRDVREAALRLAVGLAEAGPDAAAALFAAPGFDLALRQLRITLEGARAADADAVADELALVHRISTAQQQQQHQQQPEADQSRAVGGAADGDDKGAAQQPVLMLGAPPP